MHHGIYEIPPLLPRLHFKTDHALRCEENKVEILEGRFLDEELSILHEKKTEHSFELPLSIFLSFNSEFLTLKCRTLVLKPPHGDRAAAILLRWISFTKVSKYGKSEYSRALNASYTFQPLTSFWNNFMIIKEGGLYQIRSTPASFPSVTVKWTIIS